MIYKGYTAHIKYSDEDECFVGHLSGIRDIVGFHAETVKELKTAFKEAVEDYLDSCNKVGKIPEETLKGELKLKIPAETHAAVAIAAQSSGKTINQWVIEVLSRATIL